MPGETCPLTYHKSLGTSLASLYCNKCSSKLHDCWTHKIFSRFLLWAAQEEAPRTAVSMLADIADVVHTSSERRVNIPQLIRDESSKPRMWQLFWAEQEYVRPEVLGLNVHAWSAWESAPQLHDCWSYKVFPRFLLWAAQEEVPTIRIVNISWHRRCGVHKLREES